MNPLYAMKKQVFSNGSQINEDYQNLPKYYLNNFLYNSLGCPNKNEKSFGYIGMNGVTVDRKTEYKTNNFGFRCKDWTEASEILAVGCSNTYGLGVPENGSWPKILGSLSNKNVHNLSKPGVCIQELVFQIFAYCKKFGNPDAIVCLFPDPFRIIIPIKEGLVGVGKDALNSRATETLHLRTHTGRKISDRKKYLKMPYNYEDFMPMEVPLFFSMKAIHMLEQYCNSNNIKLIWSSWYDEILDVFDKLEEIPFTNFINSKEFITEQGIERICHTGYPEIEDVYFDSGQDVENGKEHAHFGVHRHLHIAEEFYKQLNKL